MGNNDLEQPRIVSSHDIHIDTDYADWIAEVKHRYRSAQVKAAVRVNAEKLLFNWQLGRDLVQKKAEERWGAGVVEQISLDLKKEFPQDDGFSTSNLWYMKKWYLFYTDKANLQILQRPIGELQATLNQSSIKLQRTLVLNIHQEINHLRLMLFCHFLQFLLRWSRDLNYRLYPCPTVLYIGYFPLRI